MSPSAPPSSTGLSVAVLGGGITGLAAAYRLTQLGHRVRLFEQSPQLGGTIRTELVDGWLVEAGPNSLHETPDVHQVLREIGLASQRVESSPAAKHRYLLRSGRVLAVPSSPGKLFTTPLFSFRAKLNLLAELFTRPRNRKVDVSLAAFARLHFGQELLDYAVQPFVSGIYAGDAEKLSTRHAFPKFWELEQRHGSLIRGHAAGAKARRARGEDPVPKIISFREGLQALPRALAAALPPDSVCVNARVESLLPGALWRVIWHDGRAARTESFDRVVCALPAHVLARLTVGTLGERPLAPLETINHPPVSSVFLGYRRDDVAHPLDGFGILVPPKEKKSVLGIVFSSTLFPGRAPPGHVALTIMVGGTSGPELASLPTEQLVPAIRADLKAILGVSAPPVLTRHTFWPRAIPQYNLGHERHLETMASSERAHRGLLIGGNARDGIALPNCLLSGLKLAERAVA